MNNSSLRPSPSQEPQCKGIVITCFLQVVEELKGAKTIQKILECLPEELREHCQLNSMMPNVWYPLEWFREAHKALQTVTQEGRDPQEGRALAELVGYHSALKDFKGVYRIFFRFVKPETILEKGARVFSTFYSVGTQEILEKRPGYARAKWVCPGFNSLIWADINGASRAALELCGASQVRIKYIEGGEDHDICSISEARWR